MVGSSSRHDYSFDQLQQHPYSRNIRAASTPKPSIYKDFGMFIILLLLLNGGISNSNPLPVGKVAEKVCRSVFLTICF